MFKVGTVCVKIAGRDAGQQCVVVDDLGKGLVLIEGAARRRKVNVKHLEPTGKSVQVKKNASHAEVMKALGLEAKEQKKRKAAEKPKAQRRVKPKAKPKVEKPKKTAKAPAEKQAPEKKED